MASTGIYEIKNTVNGKRYVGSAVDFGNRWTKHRNALIANMHHSRHLQSAWNKHGQASFEFKRLIICNRANLLMYEQAAMDALRPEYNVAAKAGSCLGVKRPLSAIEASRSKRIGLKFPEEWRENISAARRRVPGRPHTTESRKKMSDAQKGKKTPHLLRLAMLKVGVARPPDVRVKLSKGSAKLTDSQVREIRHRCANGALQRHMSEEYGIRQSCVSEIVRGVSYAWVN